MNDIDKNGLKIIKSEIFSEFKNLIFGFSTRLGGFSNSPFDSLNLGLSVGDEKEKVLENRKKFFSLLEIDEKQLVFQRQIHSNNVSIAEKPQIFPDNDALVTNVPNIFLTVGVADCVPVFLFDPVNKIVATIHAGWRGTDVKITFKTVEEIKNKLKSNPRDILAFVGPSIGPCCYEVSREVAEKFICTIEKPNKNPHLDLWTENIIQLREAGLRERNIESSNLCTSCNFDIFFSHRKGQGKTGRMMGVIGMLKKF